MSAKDGEQGFLARWSRRKAGVARSGAAPDAKETPEAGAQSDRLPAPGGRLGGSAAAAPDPASTAAATPPAAPASAEPLPTLADVARLGRESDYTPFVRPGVDPAVKNAALKKLFGDPRFNVMDGLDTYIDDYGKPDPIPLSMLRRLNQARDLGLFDAPPEDSADAPAEEPAARLPDAAPAGTPATDATEAAPATACEDDSRAVRDPLR